MSINDPKGGDTRPVEVGDTLGQYKLVELIAVGGMGLVYRAYEKSLDRFVAVKVLAHELARDPEIARRFLNEAQASATLNHPNVVHVYSAGEQAGTFYFVMELVTGGHMESLLNGALPVRESVEYIRQAALGLQHAHEHGIIHGDVKPANFLVSDSGIVKVTDFGLARRLKGPAGQTANESIFGTPAYVSPEVIHGQMPDHRSDIYSLGATLFHLLCGRPPFSGTTPEVTMRLHIQTPVPSLTEINPQVPPALNQVVTRMLAKDPSARYQSYSELIQAFDRFLSERAKADRPKTVARGLNRTITAPRPQTLAPSSAAKKPTATSTPESHTHVSMTSVVITLLLVVVCILIVYFAYNAMKTGTPQAVATNQPTPPQVSSKPSPGVNADLEEQAKPEFQALKAQADAASAQNELGRAYAIFNRWPANRFAGTLSQQAVAVERANLLETANRQWDEAAASIQSLSASNNFKDAFATCDRMIRVCDGIGELTTKIKNARHNLVTAQQEFESGQKNAQETAEHARQALIDQWKTQMDGFILNFQWETGQQEVQRLLTENSDKPALTAELHWHQLEMNSLVALRQGVTERLKLAPSARISLTTKTGELQAAISALETNQVTLRLPLGDAGFAEQTVNLTELTPPSVCRLFLTVLDKTKPDELLGYGVLIAHQALARQARVEDARKTLLAIEKLEPAQAALVQRYLDQFTALEQSQQQFDQQHRSDLEAQALWGQMQSAALQGQWAKVGDALALLTSDYGSTDFIKAHADDIKQLTLSVEAHKAPNKKGFVPLDISSDCNADYIANADGKKVKTGFYGSDQFAVGQSVKDDTAATGLPDDGRITIADNHQPCLFQLLTAEIKDSIGLSSADGRFPNEVQVTLPAEQQRQYSHLAFLFATSVGHGTFRVTMNYSVGDEEVIKIKSTDWLDKKTPTDITLAVTASDSANGKEAHLYSQIVEVDGQRKLESLTFTWISATTENPLHCIGIFAVSGQASETAQ